MDMQTIDSYDLGYRTSNRLQLLDGCEIYYELEGRGPCLTFISTIYVASTAWRNFTRRLVRNNSILTYDLRNQGASSAAPSGFQQHAKDLREILDRLDIERTFLVGTSISSVICADFAVSFPDRVSGLILLGPPFSAWGSSRRRRIMQAWLAALDAGGPRELFDQMYPLVFGDYAQATGGSAVYMALRERFLATNSAAQLRTNLADALDTPVDRELLPKVTAPTLLLAGDDDFCIGPSGLKALTDLLPDARYEVYDNCGHLPFFEATERFEASVDGFVQSTTALQQS